jgi:hypothetical protein
MAIDIFGFVVNAEISIGDIVAGLALVASPLIFWVGYRRTRKSEQIKIASELSDKIETAYTKALKFRTYNPYPASGSDDVKTTWFQQTVELDYAVERHIRYFSYLVDEKELEDRHVVNYYRDSMLIILNILDSSCTFAEDTPQGLAVMAPYGGRDIH